MHKLLAVLKYKKAIALVYLVVVLLSLWQVTQLKFHHERGRFFPGNDSDLELTELFFNEIEQDDIYVFAAAELNHSVLDSSSFQLIDSLTKACQQLEIVNAALSLSNLPKLKKTGPQLYAVPLVKGDGKKSRKKDSLEIIKHPYVINNLISEDFKSFSVLLKTVVTRQGQADTAYNDIKSVLDSFNFKDWHLSGYPIVQSVSVGALQWEMAFFTPLSGLLLLVVLLFVYRSIPGLIIPMLSLVGGMLIFFAYLNISGQGFDLMGSLFPILMLIFLMADVIHLQTHYIDKLDEGYEPLKALQISLKEIGLALFLTSFTTAIGFGTLYTSRIEAIRDFGLNSAVGVMIAFATVMIFASSGLLFFKKGQMRGNKSNNEMWVRLMERIYQFNKKGFKKIMLITGLFCVLAVWGISKISTNTFMKDEFPDAQKMKMDFEFFEEELGGVRSFEMAILPKGNFKADDPEVLIQTNKLEQYLNDSQNMHNILSPVSPYRAIHEAYTRGKANYNIPNNKAKLLKYRSLIDLDTTNQVKSLINESHTMGRMSARMKDNGSDFHAAKNDEIRQWVDRNVDPDLVEYKIVGTALMYDKNHEYLRYSLLKTMGLAFLIVGILFSILFRDYRMVIVSMIPNILPLALAAAAMGFLGITLYSLTSIFFAISFGIAVDDTIHFLTRYKLERRKGKTVDRSIRSTMHMSGKAIILTSVILVFSFFVLITSTFMGTYYIGVLVSITLIAAVLADLFLLPQLLYLINRQQAKSKKKRML